MNVRLRRYRRSDASWLLEWAPAILRTCGLTPGEFAVIVDDPGRERLVIERDAARVGVVVTRRAMEPAAAIIEVVATPPEFARHGFGMQAASLAEARLAREGVRTIYAPAAESHGIAVYFWIRLGYRPLQSPGWPCGREGMIWLRRDLAVKTAASRALRRTRPVRSTPAAVRARSSRQ